MTRSESAGLADIELKSSCMVVCHTSIETSYPCRVDVPPLHDPPHFRKTTGECERDLHSTPAHGTDRTDGSDGATDLGGLQPRWRSDAGGRRRSVAQAD